MSLSSRDSRSLDPALVATWAHRLGGDSGPGAETGLVPSDEFTAEERIGVR